MLASKSILGLCLTILTGLEAFKLKYWGGNDEKKALQERKAEMLRTITLDIGEDFRLKRSGRMKVSETRKAAGCYVKLTREKVYHKGVPLQLINSVVEGRDAMFACQYCGNSTMIYVTRVWYRLKREEISGKYLFEEVQLDTHDDESENRITTEEDHSLKIRRTHRSDVGSYFCRDPASVVIRPGTELTVAKIYALMVDTTAFGYIYHFDVLLTSETEYREVVPNSTIPDEQPAKNKHIDDFNVIMFTSWSRWGDCNMCGGKGIRKRHGSCYLTKDKLDKPVSPWYVESVMTTFPLGTPCRSTLFRGIPEIDPRPDEIELQSCTIKCRKGMSTSYQMSNMSGLSLDSLETSLDFSGKERQMKTIEMDEGAAINMSCSVVSMIKPVLWLNGSRAIATNNSTARVSISMRNVLHISTLALYDTATYYCLADQIVTDTIRLTVLAKETYVDVWRKSVYLLVTYPVDLIIYVFLLIVKNRHTLVGKHLEDDKLDAINSLSSTSSLLSSDDETDLDSTFDSNTDIE